MTWSIPDGPSTSAHWCSPAFRAELETWLDEQHRVIGDIRALEPVKHRSWSTVWRVEAAAGAFYAKQNCPLQSFEAALVATLWEHAPRHVVPLVGADLDRGLLLTPDQGPVLEESADVSDPALWERLLTVAVGLQRDVVPHVDTLVGEVGLTVLRPADAEEYVATRTEAYAALPAGDPRRLDPAVARRLQALLPRVRSWADEVAALGLPLTLNHNDLHARNAFVAPDGLRLFDFGDAVVADPLTVLLVPFLVMAPHFGGDRRDQRRLAVADAALEVWSDQAPMSALRAALPAALALGTICRVEAWTRSIATASPEELTDWGDGPAGTLAMLLDPPLVAFYS